MTRKIKLEINNPVTFGIALSCAVFHFVMGVQVFALGFVGIIYWGLVSLLILVVGMESSRILIIEVGNNEYDKNSGGKV
jgi:hypothetical protein